MVDVKVPSIIEIFFYYFALITMIEFRKNKKILYGLAVAFVLMIFITFEKQSFYRTFKSEKNTTIHIKNKREGNIIVFNEIKKDNYYFQGLNRYLLSSGIKKIDKFYSNQKEIRNKLPKITVSAIYDITDFKN
jgi:magnesium-transporting ATPase (P-type)